ncbi:MAG: MMPL family transporter, partial [Verrucomicrobiae bacterium]|nr:MMPL family transporter [Verrucomicrobiae bacterium]NNJ86759.1 MMPL family transporter [Akkermansiaceae bacterium]
TSCTSCGAATRRKIIVVILITLVSVVGLLRLGFDTDILAMLPQEVPEVHGLKAQRDVLERGGALIITLECGEDGAGLLEEEAQSLAAHLKDTAVAGEARWRPVFEEDPDGLGELLAYLWLNGDQQQWEQLIDGLGQGKSRVRLEQALNRLGTVMDMSSMQLSARDPFGFFDHDSASIFEGSESEDGGYASSDGRMHLIFARPAEPVSGYKDTKRWLRDVREAAEQWRQQEDRQWITVAFTGGPVFTSEVGDGMEKDVRGTVGLTLLLVSLLFWRMQRNLKLLGALAGMLVLIFVVTLGLASLIYGSLSMLSVGFASILIGLAVDYGMVICQEARVSGQTQSALRKSVTKGIVWASITTAAVFAALCFSSLPGVRQLGVLVAMGILAGAVIMLVFYIPIVSRMKIRAINSQGQTENRHGQGFRFPALSPAHAVIILIVALVGSSCVVAVRGLPKITFDFSVMQPSYSPGMDAMESIKERMPSWNSLGIQVVVEADNDTEMLQRLHEAQKRVDVSAQRNEITSGKMPVGLWPDAESQKKNRVKLDTLLTARERLVTEAHDAGFSDEGMSLSLAVLDALKNFSKQQGVVFPRSDAALEILQSYLWRDDQGGGLAKGRIITDVAAKPNEDDLQSLRKLNGEGAYTSGWALLSPAVLPMIHRDVTHIFVPMGAILLIMLVVVFRDIRDVVLVSCCLATPMLMVIAGMRFLELDWDMLNIVAIPLLLGMGMDYGIHMVMALRRHADQPEKVWHGIGKALMFCGASTAIGFGSLAMASNEALAGMGTLCAIGIIITMICSVFVMPGAWRVIHRK